MSNYCRISRNHKKPILSSKLFKDFFLNGFVMGLLLGQVMLGQVLLCYVGLGYVRLGLVSSNFTLKLANRKSRQKVDIVKFLILLYFRHCKIFYIVKFILTTFFLFLSTLGLFGSHDNILIALLIYFTRIECPKFRFHI